MSPYEIGQHSYVGNGIWELFGEALSKLAILHLKLDNACPKAPFHVTQ
jgi:hypothetical protein